MKQNNFGELIFNETDVVDLLMQDRDISSLRNMLVDDSVDLEAVTKFVEDFPEVLIKYSAVDDTVQEWDQRNQTRWHMPDEYKRLDIAQHILDLCDDDNELQRCGEELLLYQERNLFDLLRYLKYLVDVMTENNVVWGVGRGSSVASFILYKLRLHRINSLYYKLNINEFLR
jgi:DNA polymerase III alpha subunit